MLEARTHVEDQGVANYNRAAGLITRINPHLLSLPQYTEALQKNFGLDQREVPFNLEFPDGTTVGYEITVEFGNTQKQNPSRLFVAKYSLIPRGPAFRKIPIAKLQLIAEDRAQRANETHYGYVAIIVGRNDTTQIERDDQLPLVVTHFSEFLT